MANEDFKKTEAFIEIQKRLAELSERRKRFHPPHVSQRLKFYLYRMNNPEFDKIFKEQKRLFKRRRFLNPDYYSMKSLYQKKFARRMKDELFEILGGKQCVICGFSDERALQFDHVNGGGLLDYRKHTSHTDRIRLYYVRHPDEAKIKLQVMCANCNWIKKHEKNENSYQY